MSAVHDEALELWRKALVALDCEIDEKIYPGGFDAEHDQLIAELACALMDMVSNYDGAMEDCDIAVEVLITRIKGEADLESDRYWVCANYPDLARRHGLAPSPSGENQPET